MNIYPKRGVTYTIAEIKKLYLRDSPCLLFQTVYDGKEKELPIQDNHAGCESDNPIPKGWDETEWNYARETDEWIPIFYWSDTNKRPVTDFVDIIKEYSEFYKERYELLAYLKK